MQRLGSMRHGAATTVDEHLLEHVVMSMDHHHHRVADEIDVDADSVEVHRGEVVVCDDQGDGLGGAVLLPQLVQRHTLKSFITHTRWKMKVKEDKE